MKKLLIIILSVFVFISCGEVDPVDKWNKEMVGKIFVTINMEEAIFFVKDRYFFLTGNALQESLRNNHKFIGFALDKLMHDQRILTKVNPYNTATYISPSAMSLFTRNGSLLRLDFVINTNPDATIDLYFIDSDSFTVLAEKDTSGRDNTEIAKTAVDRINGIKTLLKDVEKEFEEYEKEFRRTNSNTNK